MDYYDYDDDDDDDEYYHEDELYSYSIGDWYVDYYAEETVLQRVRRTIRLFILNCKHHVLMVIDKNYRDHIDDLPF